MYRYTYALLLHHHKAFLGEYFYFYFYQYSHLFEIKNLVFLYKRMAEVFFDADGRLDVSSSRFLYPIQNNLPRLSGMAEIREHDLQSNHLYRMDTSKILPDLPIQAKGPFSTEKRDSVSELYSRLNTMEDFSVAICRDYVTRKFVIGDYFNLLPCFFHFLNDSVPKILQTSNGTNTVHFTIPSPSKGDVLFSSYITSKDAREEVTVNIYLQIILSCITMYKIRKFVHNNLTSSEIFFAVTGKKFMMNFLDYSMISTGTGEVAMIHTFFYSTGLARYKPLYKNGNESIPYRQVHVNSPFREETTVMTDIFTLTLDLLLKTKYPIFRKLFSYFCGPINENFNYEDWSKMTYLPASMHSNSFNSTTFMDHLLYILNERSLIFRYPNSTYFLNEHISIPYASQFDPRSYISSNINFPLTKREGSWKQCLLPREEFENIENILKGEGDLFRAISILQLDFFFDDEEMEAVRKHPQYADVVNMRNLIFKID